MCQYPLLPWPCTLIYLGKVSQWILAHRDLRKALNLTQEQVAIIMKTNQAAASRMENQSDIYVSTLRKFIRALGGEIKIVATFKDREVVINQFQ